MPSIGSGNEGRWGGEPWAGLSAPWMARTSLHGRIHGVSRPGLPAPPAVRVRKSKSPMPQLQHKDHQRKSKRRDIRQDRSEERRVGKSVDLGGRRIIKK